MQTVFWF